MYPLYNSFVAQFARALGASRILLTSSSTSKLQTAVSLVKGFSQANDVTDTNAGTEVVGINYVEEPEWEKKVLEMTGGEGVDVVVDVSLFVPFCAYISTVPTNSPHTV